MPKPEGSLNILISAGPTREYIDPVRFISNPSTGKIGYEIARIAVSMGHNVILLSGPTFLKQPPGATLEYFETARDLEKIAKKHFSWCDCFISSAAVGDFRPRETRKDKIKKGSSFKRIELVKNPDIIKILSKMKKKGQIIVGFALESNDLKKNALSKLKSKKMDFIVANQVKKGMSPFGQGKTNISILSVSEQIDYSNISKSKLARIILDRVTKLCYSLTIKKKEVIRAEK